MSCPKFYELLDFSANILPPEEKNALKAHFQNCSKCQQRLPHIQSLQGRLHHYFEASEQSASEALRAQTFAQLAMDRKTLRSHYRISSFALVAVVLLLVSFWVISVNSSLPSIKPSPEEQEAKLNPTETLLLTKMMNSELKEMIHDEEKEWEMDLEKETDLLAEDYLEEVIFATIED
ncbi:MAG: hypothetical protein AABZ60_02995 [Planctomycetota bacterium]|mgnify:CR=1 FL=1